MGRSHLLVGAAGALAVSKPLLIATTGRTPTTGELVATTVVCAGAAMLPDIDHPQATVSRALGPVTWFLSRACARVLGGHRSGTHSILFAVVLSWALTSLIVGLSGPLLPLFLCFFFASLAVRVLTEAEGAVCAVLAAGVASALLMATSGDSYTWLAPAIGLGWLLHIAADLLTTEGTAFLWPLSKTFFRFPIVGHTGGFRERLVAALCGFAATWLYTSTVVLPALFR
jgi:membrane-bound metal-dependent hydrolase YbcI (DUF457 family)